MARPFTVVPVPQSDDAWVMVFSQSGKIAAAFRVEYREKSQEFADRLNVRELAGEAVMKWIIGDPRSHEAEAMDAAVDRDDAALGACLAELGVTQLVQLMHHAHYLANACADAARARS